MFRTAAERGMRTRVALYPGWDPEHPLADLSAGDKTGQVRVAGVKVVLDGAYSNRTAWVHKPYPESCDHARMHFGIATHTVFFFAEYDGYQKALGAAQVPDAYPIARLYAGVAALALSSDRPATAWSGADDVMMSIEAAVRHRTYNGVDFGREAAIRVPQARHRGSERLHPGGGVHRIVSRERSDACDRSADACRISGVLKNVDEPAGRSEVVDAFCVGRRG